MKFSFSKDEWRGVRPSEFKALNVGKTMDACKSDCKAPSELGDEKKRYLARNTAEKLDDLLKAVEGKCKGKADKAYKETLTHVIIWRRELSKYLDQVDAAAESARKAEAAAAAVEARAKEAADAKEAEERKQLVKNHAEMVAAFNRLEPLMAKAVQEANAATHEAQRNVQLLDAAIDEVTTAQEPTRSETLDAMRKLAATVEQQCAGAIKKIDAVYAKHNAEWKFGRVKMRPEDGVDYRKRHDTFEKHDANLQKCRGMISGFPALARKHLDEAVKVSRGSVKVDDLWKSKVERLLPRLEKLGLKVDEDLFNFTSRVGNMDNLVQEFDEAKTEDVKAKKADDFVPLLKRAKNDAAGFVKGIAEVKRVRDEIEAVPPALASRDHSTIGPQLRQIDGMLAKIDRFEEEYKKKDAKAKALEQEAKRREMIG